MAFEHLKEQVIHYQERCLAIAGDCARGVDWKSEEDQRLLFRVIHSMGIRPDSSILDVGCGLAHFYDFIADGDYRGEYTGIDISPALIAQARKRLPHVDLRVADILDTPLSAQSYDFVIASGVFSGRLDTPPAEFETYVKEMINRMYSGCRVATVFNMLTSYVDYEAPHLYYANPSRYLELAKSMSRFVSLRHDSPGFFFTMAMYREANAYADGADLFRSR